MENTSKFPAAPNRRAVVAFIALADIPVPNEIDFHDEKSLFLKVDTAAEVDAWVALLGLDSHDTIRADEGKDIVSGSAFGINGWYVNVTAYVLAGRTENLTAKTRSALEAVAQ